ncbi:hypothetical protein RDI58_027231 [Solanum bulbocastanum]|uniref:Uncharacterized protein n=1 Tax=Solanum bulbocastanum TaxID=147425 RepID=A0AAN8Y1M6_SOLBU
MFFFIVDRYVLKFILLVNIIKLIIKFLESCKCQLMVIWFEYFVLTDAYD